MSGITKNRKRVTAANANKKQKKSKKKVSINAAELEEMVSRQNFFFIKICYTNIFPKFEIILFPIFDAFIDVVLLGHRQPVILV